MVSVVPLADWYPRFGGWTGTPVSERVGWVIHHTVGGTGQDPEAYARGVADYHYGRWGVPGGYNYLIGEDGVVRVMCGLPYRGVHSGTHEWNRKSLGLAFQGDFRNQPPSDVMLDAARELIADTPAPTDQWGHRDVRPEPTTCPGGELYDLLPLEDDMALSQEDLDKIGQLIDERLKLVTLDNGKRISYVALDSTWNVPHGGRLMKDNLVDARRAAEDGGSGASADEVVDEIAERLADEAA